MGRARGGKPALKAAEKLPSSLSLRKIVILFYADIARTASFGDEEKQRASDRQKNVALRPHPLEYTHFLFGTPVAEQSGRQCSAGESVS
jgi:hypothetical protein